MKYIVLAHGVLGFNAVGFNGFNIPKFNLIGFETPAIEIDEFAVVSYFNGIKPALKKLGYGVVSPSVPSVGSIDERAAVFYKKLRKVIIKNKIERKSIAIFAHSLGGLDARMALTLNGAWLADYVKCLVTIGTPHLGSPVAELLANKNFITTPLYRKALFVFGSSVGALKNLTPTFCQHFDATTKNVDGVSYYSIAGLITADAKANYSAFFTALGQQINEPNDGVVTLDSAAKANDDWTNLETWHVDHAGLVGWFDIGPGSLASTRQHINRYCDLANTLLPLP